MLDSDLIKLSGGLKVNGGVEQSTPLDNKCIYILRNTLPNPTYLQKTFHTRI